MSLLYRRILFYFRDDALLLTTLVVLIWISLAAGVLEGAAVGTLTDTVLSSHPSSQWMDRLLFRILPVVHGHVHQIVMLAIFWLSIAHHQ